jgi:NAD(P)-dependent dehydrogenase (short-subunit alcohol dehydrogenase family)
MAEFSDKVVIVTGGAKGIGRGICLAFAEAGAKVLCADVDEAAGAELTGAGKAWAGEIRFHRADVSQGAECQGLVQAAVDSWGGVDVVCNNVGIQPPHSYLPAHEMPDEMWDRIIDVNLKSGFLMTKYSVQIMKARGGGVIVNTASVQGLQSMQGVSAYAASKGGMLSLTRQLALEYARDNIRVLAVNPGTIDTPLVDEAVAAIGGNKEEMIKEWNKAHPLGRIGKPVDIANVVLFLASDKASFMTGEYVCVDGGMMALGAWASAQTPEDD